MIQIEKWHVVYRKLSELLNKIEEKNTETRGKQLYSKCFGDKEFRDNNEWIEKFYSKWKRKSLDPIHVFASINGNKLRYENRIQRINILFRLLDNNFKEEYKEINFDGCPAPITLQMIGARNEDDQNEIWSVFGEVMTKSQKATIDFAQVKSWFGLDIRSFTIFLFWIDADNFLSLDKNTEAVLSKYDKIKAFPKRYEEYKSLLTEKDTNLYRLLAYVAIDNSQLETMSQENRSKVESYLTGKDIVVDAEFYMLKQPDIVTLDLSTDFRLIAIKPLEGCKKEYLKTLKEGEYYLFDSSYEISDTKIKKNKEKNISLFDLYDVNGKIDKRLNINAIVGKNGTGKSTIVELLFAFINNLAAIKKINKDIKPIEDLKVEFLYEHEHIYKITIDGDAFTCKKFDTRDEKFIDIQDFKIKDLFYTVAVNYSQHSLNSLILGDWIYSLFHKNDSYKTPIVIEPYRKEGNMDVNRQEKLIKQRLLSTLLAQEDENDKENSPRKLTEFYRAEKLELTFNIEKIFYKTDNIKRIAGKYIYKDDDKKITIQFHDVKNFYTPVLKKLYEKYTISRIPKKDFYKDSFKNYTFDEKVDIYIFKKLISIAIRYEKYQNYFEIENHNFTNIDKYIDELYKDTSHIVYKLKQAIYFLKFDTKVKHVENKERYSIEDLSDAIDGIMQDNENLTIDELIPPSFFDVDIILENDINFSTLSSGEKQKIYSVNSILYQINNINSVDETLTKYRYINIILDEIELYFHPELQRQYLNYLRQAISKANTISAINILFITHSPFILSDIPDTKILFLDKKDDPNAKSLPVDGVPTFGANIHELLINGFFMKNSIGDFALEKIKSIVYFYYKVIGAKEKELQLLKEEYDKLKNELYFIQQHIGEKYIADIIKNHIEDIEKTLNADDFKKKKIEWLEQELKRLKGQENQND